MTGEEHAALIHDIAANLTDQSKVTEMLTRLSNDYTEMTEKVAKLPQLEKDNENLRSVNMKLFLQVGDKPKGTGKEVDAKEQQETGEITNTETKPKFDDLFNEKGELK